MIARRSSIVAAPAKAFGAYEPSNPSSLVLMPGSWVGVSSTAQAAGVTDVDGPSLSITAVSIASGGGSLVDNHDGTWSYAPAHNYSGPVGFNYTASDGTLASNSTASL